MIHSEVEERRKYPRTDLILKIAYPTSENLFADYTHNVSSGGAFVATSKPFSIGEKLALDISFPGLLPPTRCFGEVRWRRSNEEVTYEIPGGVGVALSFTSDQESVEMKRLLDGLTQRLKPKKKTGKVTVPFRVLLAEDSALVREMFRFAVCKFHGSRLTSGRTLDVIEAKDGGEAWDRIRESSFDMAIIDYYMPVMNGGELIRKIRNDASLRSLPIVVVSIGGEEAGREAYTAGADLYLTKPVLLKQLLVSLEQLLGLKRGQTGE